MVSIVPLCNMFHELVTFPEELGRVFPNHWPQEFTGVLCKHPPQV